MDWQTPEMEWGPQSPCGRLLRKKLERMFYWQQIKPGDYADPINLDL
jgi:hypothetical protein